MKIGLMGCEFSSANKGCDALTYSFLSLLNNIDSINKETTIYNFSSTSLGLIPKEFPNFHFVNVSANLKDPKFRYIRALHKCDVIFDATMGDSFSDIYSETYYKWLIKHKRISELLCKKYILLPQTYGPFNNDNAEKMANKVFKRATKIYCRDELSKELLENKFNLKDIELSSDMAFMLPYNKELYKFNNNKKIRLGINISGLLYKGGFHSNNQFDLSLDYKKYVDGIIENYSKNDKYEVHLIPHVIDLKENSYDDDYKTCNELQKKYKKCILAPAFNTPIEAKSYIANMDIFVGSRMHSTIASFSSNVCTIPVSYSRKFEGLFNSLDYEYVINGKKESTESAIDKTINYIENCKELKNKQSKSLKIIENKNEKFILSIKKIIEKLK